MLTGADVAATVGTPATDPDGPDPAERCMADDPQHDAPATGSEADPFAFQPPRPSRPRQWDVALAIAAGGAVGGACRWAVNEALPTSARGFPWETFVENVTGCFLLASAMVLLLDVLPPHRYARPFLGTGVLGGFTTFSTYTLDTRVLIEAGEGGLAMAYLFGSMALGLVAVVAGLTVTRAVTGVVPHHKMKGTR